MDIPTLALAKAYTDSQRLAYEETKTITFLPPTKSLYVGGGIAAFNLGNENNPIPFDMEIVVGQDYIVDVDGIVHDCIGTRMDAFGNGDEYDVIISKEFVEGNSDGRHVALIRYPATNSPLSGTSILAIIVPDGVYNRMVSIKTTEHVIKTIDPMFIRSGGSDDSSDLEYINLAELAPDVDFSQLGATNRILITQEQLDGLKRAFEAKNAVFRVADIVSTGTTSEIVATQYDTVLNTGSKQMEASMVRTPYLMFGISFKDESLHISVSVADNSPRATNTTT